MYAARMQKVRPLSTAGGATSGGIPTDDAPVAEALEAAPILPAFDVEQAEESDAVGDRIALWQRKLLV